MLPLSCLALEESSPLKSARESIGPREGGMLPSSSCVGHQVSRQSQADKGEREREKRKTGFLRTMHCMFGIKSDRDIR